MTTQKFTASDPLSEESVQAVMRLLEQEGKNYKSISRISEVLDRLSDHLNTDAAYDDRRKLIELLQHIHAQQSALADEQTRSNNLLSRILSHVMWIAIAASAIAVKILWF